LASHLSRIETKPRADRRAADRSHTPRSNFGEHVLSHRYSPVGEGVTYGVSQPRIAHDPRRSIPCALAALGASSAQADDGNQPPARGLANELSWMTRTHRDRGEPSRLRRVGVMSFGPGVAQTPIAPKTVRYAEGVPARCGWSTGSTGPAGRGLASTPMVTRYTSWTTAQSQGTNVFAQCGRGGTYDYTAEGQRSRDHRLTRSSRRRRPPAQGPLQKCGPKSPA